MISFHAYHIRTSPYFFSSNPWRHYDLIPTYDLISLHYDLIPTYDLISLHYDIITRTL